MSDIAQDVRPSLTGRRALAFAALMGAAAALGQAPVSLPWITLLALALVYPLYWRAPGWKAAFCTGWAFGTGYFAAALFWIVEPFFVDIARDGWMAPFAMVFSAGGFALFWGGGFALGHALCRGGRGRALAFATGLTAMELLRSHVLTGFPWALAGHVWIGWAPMQLAAWIGPLGLTFLTFLAPALAMTVWPRKPALAAVVLPFALLYGLGAWQAARPVPAAPDAPVLRIVQPNATQHLKWDPAHAATFFWRQVDFTAAPADGPRPDLVIWPETAIPNPLHRAGDLLARVAEAAAGVPVVLGIQRTEEYRAYNSLILLDAQGQVAEVYDKHHLVPFGEYLPAGALLSRIGLSAFTAQQGYGYSPGPGARVLDLPGAGKAVPLICYEAIFPQDVNAAPARADWLLQITNDAWFGNVSGPYQHLAQARLRAVEQGLPMVRAANTGISAVIDARGRILHSLPLNRAGFFDAPLPPPLPPTLYSRTGDGPMLAVLALAALALIALRRRATP